MHPNNFANLISINFPNLINIETITEGKTSSWGETKMAEIDYKTNVVNSSNTTCPFFKKTI